MSTICIENIHHTYVSKSGIFGRKRKEVEALTGISFTVNEGEIFGLLGPNGAGKTTMVKILITLLIPTSGSATVLGYNVVSDAAKLRPLIGFVLGGERGVYWRLSGRENLRYFSDLYGIPPAESSQRISELLELVGLSKRSDDKVEGYSRGMKQRLHIARCLLHNPRILFLDEPTLGLDPVGAREIRSLIKQFQEEGRTIFLTTHYMFEADELCDRVAVISKGTVAALDSPRELKRFVADLHVIECEVYGILPRQIERIKTIASVTDVAIRDEDGTQRVFIHTKEGGAAMPRVISILEGTRVGNINLREPTLEDAYVRLVGGEID